MIRDPGRILRPARAIQRLARHPGRFPHAARRIPCISLNSAIWVPRRLQIDRQPFGIVIAGTTQKRTRRCRSSVRQPEKRFGETHPHHRDSLRRTR